MNGSYPAARVAAQRLEEHFAINAGNNQNVSTASAIEQIISAAFWASLRQEEGRAPKISLTLLPPEQAAHPMRFDPWLPLAPDKLARMAPAVERPGIHLGVWWQNNELAVWGSTRTVPTYSFVLEVIAPGLLVAKYRGSEESTKFVNFAVLEGADVKFIDQAGPIVPALASAGEAESVLSQLAIAIRAHGHGGSLLIVPRHSHEWRESIIRPVTYSVMPPYSEISMLLKQEDPGPALRAAIEAIAGFTAVDGATIISEDFDLMAFGAKIMRRYGAERVQQVIFTEPIQGAVRIELDPSQLGGTRHLSAAQFVHDQRNTKALVASQDGRFTVFTWSDPDKSVLAHRIESLLI